MEYTIKITEAEVIRVLVALNTYRKVSPTADNLIWEIEKQTGVEL